MMMTRRCAGLAALILMAAAALILAGCGGGGDGDAGVQTGSVSGTITYAATGDALGGIRVSIGNITATTNASGQFTLNRVPAGQRTLAVAADPDRNLVLPPGVPLTVTVRAGETTRLSAPIQMIDDVDAPPAPPS
ncbi:MAG: carboxypeptidase regulatory-like domain-containing protein [Armatimonadota bacterium]|jgi:hypothetical protein